MSAIGPELPPHLLAKRKRKEDDDVEDGSARTAGAKRSSSPDEGEKRRRVIGPAMPPAPLEERPDHPANATGGDESDSDDDFGPSLPSVSRENAASVQAASDETTNGTSTTQAPERLKRDDWMMMPPKQDDLAARLDPLKPRARGFNSSKGAKGPNAAADDNSAWSETPEQKQKRLQDEMMGIAKPASTGPPKSTHGAQTTRVDENAAKTREQIEKVRGPSLMDQHKEGKGKDVEDDPSTRAFDREKDMSTGMRIGSTQRKDLLNQAAGFSSKFSGGSYL